MAGGDGLFGSSRRRWALAGAAVIVIAAGVLTVLVTGDSDPAEAPPQPVAQGDVPVSTPEETTEGANETAKAPRNDDRGGEAESTEPDQAREGKKANPSAGSGDARRSARQEPSRCPAGLSDAQCTALAEAIQNAGVGAPGKDGECPPGWSNEECDALGEAYQQAAEGSPVQEPECPPGLTQEQCEALR